ncbi:hypothetical protein ABT072_25890 [Streptomyces sp. NPDC002589]|uniref:hypothetical protein n=1 Tax=Streptomyces sp. NPDC002589 TaxID=3154420 RepID=UPI00331E71AA
MSLVDRLAQARAAGVQSVDEEPVPTQVAWAASSRAAVSWQSSFCVGMVCARS